MRLDGSSSLHSELTRREAIAALGVAALTPLSLSEVRGDAADKAGGLRDPLVHSSAAALAQAIRAKQLSSVEVVKAYLLQIDRVNPKLNAVVQLARDAALRAAADADRRLATGERVGLLHGVPITIKDSIDTAGLVTTAGTVGRRNYVPPADATVVARLRRAGAILLGHTNTPEITDGGETDNAVYGRTNNPYNVSRTPGGSSGGAAAIVAAAGSAFDIGSDTTGSIRGPAHFCGIAGIKPSVGRVPRTGHIIAYGAGALDSYTQLGPLARHVEDLDLALRIIVGPDWRDPTVGDVPLGDRKRVDLRTLRVAFHVDNGIKTPTPETQNAVRRAARALDGVVRQVEERRPPGIERGAEVSTALIGAVFRELATRTLRSAGTANDSISRKVKGDIDELSALPPKSAADLDRLLADQDLFRSEMLSFMEHHDIILCPVNAFPALPHGQQQDAEHGAGWSYCSTYSATGWPAGVVRAGTSPEGMPIGVQVVGRPWRDDVVLAVMAELERALGGWTPPK